MVSEIGSDADGSEVGNTGLGNKTFKILFPVSATW
jgi:hypothetical protein